MPVLNVPAAVLLNHNGVTIYHAYKNTDDPVDEPMSYHYSFDASGEMSFDVRDLPNPHFDKSQHEAIIRYALDNGHLSPPKSPASATPPIGVTVQNWQPFNYTSFEPGVFWVSYTVPQMDVDATDDGHLVGSPTGQMRYDTALVYIDDDNGFPVFEQVIGDTRPRICETALITHYAEVHKPAPFTG